MKVCSRCGRHLPRAEFWRERRASDGLRSACRACLGPVQRDYFRLVYYPANRLALRAAAIARKARAAERAQGDAPRGRDLM